MKMDPTTVQTLVTVGSFLVLSTIYIVNGRMTGKILAAKLEVIDGTMEDFKKEIKKLTDVLIAQAVQAKRLDMVEERMLAQGKRLDEQSQRLNLYADSPIYRRREESTD